MTEPIVMIDHIVFGSAHDAAVYCASQRNEHLALARSFRDDVWWFKAHDHEEYAMQNKQGSVAMEVAIAWEYHAHAMNLRRLDRETPKQATLF